LEITVPFSFLHMAEDEGPSPREPDAVCDRCNRRGTAVRVTQHLTPDVITRYCSPCWHEVRGDICPPVPTTRPSPRAALAFLRRTQGPPVTIVSRSWDDTVDFINILLRPPQAATLQPEQLDAHRARIAAEILSGAADMDGPMPASVRAFVEKYRQPA
jgi:hypothetical protein